MSSLLASDRMTPWPPELRDEIGNTLIIAGNALVGYVQLSNADETEEHHQAALHALEAVQAAIRKCGVLEAQGIVPPSPGIEVGSSVRLTDEVYRNFTPTSPFKTGAVLSIHDGLAEVGWLDPALPRYEGEQRRAEDMHCAPGPRKKSYP